MFDYLGMVGSFPDDGRTSHAADAQHGRMGANQPTMAEHPAHDSLFTKGRLLQQDWIAGAPPVMVLKFGQRRVEFLAIVYQLYGLSSCAEIELEVNREVVPACETRAAR